jgi:hypothetical protein
MSLLPVHWSLVLLLLLQLLQPQLQGNMFPSSGEEVLIPQELLLQKQIVGATVAASQMVTGGTATPHLVLAGVQGHLQLGHLPGFRVIVSNVVMVFLIFARVLCTLHSLSSRILFDTQFSFIYLPMFMNSLVLV